MDITERVEIEQALEESLNRFRVAISSVPLLVFTCDSDLRTTWIYNPPQGYRTEDVLGKRDDEVLPPEDVVEVMAAKQHALDTGQGGMHEIKMKYGGEERNFILTTDPIRNALGEVTGLTCASIDITEQRRLEIERQEAQMKMEVQRRLMDQREKERQGIARDIHDGPIQTLASTAFNIQFVKESFPDPTLTVELNQIALNVKSAVRELREVVNDLRPPSIIRFGLSRAIMMHAEDLRERYPETELELYLDEDGPRLSDQACLTVFRVFQEGMNYIFRHAGASKVQVKYTVTETQFVLELVDNGRGFAVPKDYTNLTIDGHYGLAGMKERVEAVGGTFTIKSAPGKGTTITVRGPLAGANVK